MNLGRPFKAGIVNSINSASRERRLNSTVAHATERLLVFLFRALKGPAKFTRPLRGPINLTPMGLKPRPT
jgi:hypothetical protein